MICTAAPHLQKAFYTPIRERAIHDAIKTLSAIDFDVIVVCGMSGTVLGSVVAHEMKKKLAVVRKKGEQTVSCMSLRMEGWHGGKYIFFDDLISSGSTRSWACTQFDSISQAAGEDVFFVGTYTYDFDTWSPARIK